MSKGVSRHASSHRPCLNTAVTSSALRDRRTTLMRRWTYCRCHSVLRGNMYAHCLASFTGSCFIHRSCVMSSWLCCKSRMSSARRMCLFALTCYFVDVQGLAFHGAQVPRIATCVVSSRNCDLSRCPFGCSTCASSARLFARQASPSALCAWSWHLGDMVRMTRRLCTQTEWHYSDGLGARGSCHEIVC